MYRILIVEDDAAIASATLQSLVKWGYDARTITDFQHVDVESAAYDPHLVIMDISLPFFNGFYWCQRLRERSNMPILFVSSHNQSSDQVMAMNLGADDYITKPFSLDILLAKIAALLRRCYSYDSPSESQVVSGATLNLKDATLQTKTERVELTRNETRILHTLFSSINEIVSRESLMKALWDDDVFVDDNTLTVNMGRLRKKLDGAGLEGLIQTKKGLGYLIHD